MPSPRLEKQTRPPSVSRKGKIPNSQQSKRSRKGARNFVIFFPHLFFFRSFKSQLREMEHSVPEALIVPQAQTIRLSLRWTTWRKHSERLRRSSADPRRQLLCIDASHKKKRKKKAILCSGELALRDMIHELGKAGCFLEVIGLSALMKRSSHTQLAEIQNGTTSVTTKSCNLPVLHFFPPLPQITFSALQDVPYRLF